MTVISQHLSTILTLASSEFINTGNRVLDNSIIALITFLIIQSINFITNDWKRLYNIMIFYLYNMKKHPLDMRGVPFIYTTQYETSQEIAETFIRRSCSWLFLNYNNYSKHINNNCNLVTYAISNFVRKNNLTNQIINKKKEALIMEDIYKKLRHTHCLPCFEEKTDRYFGEGIYILAIDNLGYPIYYSTDFTIFIHDNFSYDYAIDFIAPVLLDEIEKIKIKHNHGNTPHTNIYTFKKLDTSDTGSALNMGFTITKQGTISSKKTFNTLFYTQKEELINILNKFNSECLYPSHIPMDNKLGIMLYGPPGTGKTGTITAIANYLGRNLTLINFSEISSTEEFDKMLDSTRYKETIFVFDEFDYLLDALVSNKDKYSDQINWGTLLMSAEGQERKEILNTIKQNAKFSKKDLTISYLLQKLDGLESADGRIIIATTNNPDKINPALMRPGRFDIKLCLGNCTQDMYGKILENYYKNEKDVYNRVLEAKIPTYKYSPLELINLAMQSETLDILLEKIFCEYKNNNCN
jgi:hypothetical protein